MQGQDNKPAEVSYNYITATQKIRRFDVNRLNPTLGCGCIMDYTCICKRESTLLKFVKDFFKKNV